MSEIPESYQDDFSKLPQTIDYNKDICVFALINEIIGLADASVENGKKNLSEESIRALKMSSNSLRKMVLNLLEESLRLANNKNSSENLLQPFPIVTEDNAAIAAALYHIISDVFTIGSRGTVTESAKKYFENKKKVSLGKKRGQQQAETADKWRIPFFNFAIECRRLRPKIAGIIIVRDFRKSNAAGSLNLPAENKDMSALLARWTQDCKLPAKAS